MSSGSLRIRLLFTGMLAVVLAFGCAVYGLSALFQSHVERRVVDELRIRLDQIVARIEVNGFGNLVVTGDIIDPRFEAPLSGLYWKIDSGRATLRSRSLWDSDLVLKASGTSESGALRTYRATGPSGTDLLVADRRVILPARLGKGSLRAAVAIDLSEISAATDAFMNALYPFLVLTAAAWAVMIWLQVTVGLRPLATIRDRINAIRLGGEQRLGEGFPKEVRPLAAAVDALLEARDEQVEKAKRRAADLAHGMKTPLQVLSGDVDRLRGRGEREIAEGIQSVVASLSRQVDHELARSRIGSNPSNTPADVRAIVTQIADVVARTPTGARLDWSIDLPDKLLARIEPYDLSEALGNLIENASKHASTTVSISGGRDQGHVRVTVRDDGPGVPENHLAELTDRGQRIDTSNHGAGLGLAIVRATVEPWNGELRLANADPGFAATLRLPAIALIAASAGDVAPPSDEVLSVLRPRRRGEIDE